jgi:DNA-directed RNA polymerase subunit RPC12/RpoP
MPKVKLKCPKCKKEFTYSYIVGVPINTIKTWNYRYMQCLLCRHWSLFKLSGRKPAIMK